MFVDTHCHLNFRDFTGELPDVLARAKKEGVGLFINPAIDLGTSQDCLLLSEKHKEIYAAVGVHPNDIEGVPPESIQLRLSDLIDNNNPVAIGEIGLDYYHNSDIKSQQKRILEIQMELAIEKHLPVILHSRNSLNDLIKMCETLYSNYMPHNCSKYYGVFHAFEGNPDEAMKAIQMGFMIGIGGPITYKNARLKQDVVRSIPLSSILLETDSPFLSPSPMRGKRNEPANIKIIAESVAILKECDIKLVEYQTTRNARALFNIGEEIDFN